MGHRPGLLGECAKFLADHIWDEGKFGWEEEQKGVVGGGKPLKL